MKASEAKALIGQVVLVRRRGYCDFTGEVTEVIGRNICIDGDWPWLPDCQITAAPPPSEQ